MTDLPEDNLTEFLAAVDDARRRVLDAPEAGLETIRDEDAYFEWVDKEISAFSEFLFAKHKNPFTALTQDDVNLSQWMVLTFAFHGTDGALHALLTLRDKDNRIVGWLAAPDEETLAGMEHHMGFDDGKIVHEAKAKAQAYVIKGRPFEHRVAVAGFGTAVMEALRRAPVAADPKAVFYFAAELLHFTLDSLNDDEDAE